MLSGIWLGLLVSASGDAAQSASMFITVPVRCITAPERCIAVSVRCLYGDCATSVRSITVFYCACTALNGVLRCITLHCAALRCVAVYRGVLRCVAAYYGVLRCNAVQCGVLRCWVRCITALCGIARTVRDVRCAPLCLLNLAKRKTKYQHMPPQGI